MADAPAGLDAKARRVLVARYRVTKGENFRLADHDPGETGPLDKDAAETLLAAGVDRLSSLQERLFADRRFAVLAVFQAMDAGGKDGTIRHVMSGINPAGVTVTAFKQPGPVEAAHDFLWRINLALPERGRIGIFNRSHYEDVLVTRVHPDILAGQALPLGPDTKGHVPAERFWRRRLKDIAHFERYLGHQNIHVIKFFLNVSKEEQRQRLLARLEDDSKTWKFSASDLRERDDWPTYQRAYEAAIAATARKRAPWLVVPADHKWFARLVVVEALICLLEDLDPRPPPPAHDQKELDAARRRLRAQD